MEKRKLRRDLINIYKNLKGGLNEDRAMLFSVMFSARKRSSGGHKLEHKRFYLNVKKHFFTVQVVEHWHRSPRVVVGCPSWQILKSCL